MMKLLLPLFLLTVLSADAQKTVRSFGFQYFEKTAGSDSLVITEIVEGSNAKKAGLKSGDLVTAINEKPVQSLSAQQIRDEFAASNARGTVSLQLRNGSSPVVVHTSDIAKVVCLSGNCINGPEKQLNSLELYEYEGNFKNGRYDGEGTKTFKKNYTKYTVPVMVKQWGTYENGEFMLGTSFFSNGSSFAGRLKNNIPFGFGIYTTEGRAQRGSFDEQGNFTKEADN